MKLDGTFSRVAGLVQRLVRRDFDLQEPHNSHRPTLSVGYERIAVVRQVGMSALPDDAPKGRCAVAVQRAVAERSATTA